MAEAKVKEQSRQSSNGPPAPPAAHERKETRADKFKRLANRRVPDAVNRIRKIGNLALPSQYEYTPDQAAKIVKILSDEVAAIRSRFEGGYRGPEVASIF